MVHAFCYSPDGCSEVLFQEIENGELLSTNYFKHELCQNGLFKGLYFDGVYYLLIPTVTVDHGVVHGSGEDCLREMRTGRFVIADVGMDTDGGRPVVNLVFDDGSDAPYSVTVPKSQSNPFFVEDDDAQKGLLFKAYIGPDVKASLVLEMKLRFVDDPHRAWPWDPRIDEIPNPALRIAARRARDQGQRLEVIEI